MITVSHHHLQQSFWGQSWRKFKTDKAGLFGAALVLLFFVTAMGVWLGLWGQNWSETSDLLWTKPSVDNWFGTNMIGQDVFQRSIFSTKVAFEVGLVVTFFATVLGAVLGAVSGYFNGSYLDSLVLWIMGVLDSIPFYLFVAAVAFALKDYPYAMHVAMILTFWTTSARIIRGEFIKLKSQEFVEAGLALGVSSSKIIFKHILPNTSHLILIQATITFIAAIKSEVILSFLGLGIKDGVSWGLMIYESTQDILSGHFNNFIAASGFLFILVIAFNLFSDSLQDSLDPKLVK